MNRKRLPPRAPSSDGRANVEQWQSIYRWAVGLTLIATFVWSYWPTLSQLVHIWDSQPDYSHGYLVVPVAIWMLFARRSQLSLADLRPSWAGLALVMAACALRITGSALYIDALDGWSIPLWIGGIVWLCGGLSLLRWAWPSIVFLLFMVPLPFQVETMLSLPLQAWATKLSTWSLQILGQPAIAEGNVIHVDNQMLEVEQACSGLRMFVGIAAMAFVFVLLSRRSWWQKVLLIISVGPIALVANSMRIVAMGLFNRYASQEVGEAFSAHDLSGWIMIPLAAGMFWLVLVYLDRLVYDVVVVDRGNEPRKWYSRRRQQLG